MARFADLPDEVILQILGYNVPLCLNSRLDLQNHIHKHIISKRFYELSKDAFFEEFTHNVNIRLCRQVIPSVYTSLQGIIVGRLSFTRRVRRLRVHITLSTSHTTSAVTELENLLGQYDRVVHVDIAVTSQYAGNGTGLKGKIASTLEVWRTSLDRRVEVNVKTSAGPLGYVKKCTLVNNSRMTRN